MLLDMSWLTWRGFYSLKSFETEELAEAMTVNILDQIHTVCSDRRVESNLLHLFYDSRKSFRKQDFPEYKAHRGPEPSKEDLERIRIMRVTADKLRTLLFEPAGFPTYRHTGLESDDLIAQSAWVCYTTGERAVMVTSDQDLYQSIFPGVPWWNPMKDEWVEFSEMPELKGVTTDQWRAVKTLAGCSSDGVPGIKGVGEATAIKYLTNTLSPKSLVYQRIISDEGRVTVERNKRLVTLPHPKTPEVILPRKVGNRPGVYNVTAFWAALEAMDATTMLQGVRRKNWDRLMAGEFRRGAPRRRGEK